MNENTPLVRMLTIDFDSGRDEQIQISSPQNAPEYGTDEFAGMLLLDTSILCKALVGYIKAMHQSGIKDESESIRDCISDIQGFFADTGFTVAGKMEETVM